MVELSEFPERSSTVELAFGVKISHCLPPIYNVANLWKMFEKNCAKVDFNQCFGNKTGVPVMFLVWPMNIIKSVAIKNVN